ncbi:PRONE domain [Dillenia turbinata]|uniref:PRONE domain n=1 Tax=Dillenia turbinata TaxID=194707 RepID=A0AAN8YTI3_9MAGN
MEQIMVTRQRVDLLMNIPALRKLDAMHSVRRHLIMSLDCLDNFKEQNELTYVSKNADETEKAKNKRKDSVHQVLKAAMAIKAQGLSEMEIPEDCIVNLPKEVGQAVLESYSRLVGGLASRVMSRIEDVLYDDSVAQNPSLATKNPMKDVQPVRAPLTFLNPGQEMKMVINRESVTLSDFIGWNMYQSENETKKGCEFHHFVNSDDQILMKKPPPTINTNKSFIHGEA